MTSDGVLTNRSQFRSQIGGHGNQREAIREKSIVMHVKVEDLKRDEIAALSEKSGSVLDPSNSLDLIECAFKPNPTNGTFGLSLNLPEEGNTEIRIFDAQGQTLVHEELNGFSGKYNQQFDLSEQASGVYFISVMQAGKGKTMRIIKQ